MYADQYVLVCVCICVCVNLDASSTLCKSLHVSSRQCVCESVSSVCVCVCVCERDCERGNNSLTSASGLCTECSCQQNLIFLPLSFPVFLSLSLSLTHSSSLSLSLLADRSSLLGALGVFLAALTALNNSKGPTTVISKRKDRDLEGKRRVVDVMEACECVCVCVCVLCECVRGRGVVKQKQGEGVEKEQRAEFCCC